jgi:hypothetical protein
MKLMGSHWDIALDRSNPKIAENAAKVLVSSMPYSSSAFAVPNLLFV